MMAQFYLNIRALAQQIAALGTFMVEEPYLKEAEQYPQLFRGVFYLEDSLEIKIKKCSKCGIEKPITEFYKHGKNSRGEQTYRSDCKLCQRNYDLNRKYKREEFINAQKIKCLKCGEIDKSKLHFHHVDPSKKEFTIGRMRNYSFEKIQAEINKCVVLCAHCHETFHQLNRNYGITLDRYLGENK